MGIFKKLFGKKSEEEKVVLEREDQPDVHYIRDEDNRMNWAMEKARLTFHYFKSCLENPKETQAYFSVKAKIEENGIIEHIWLGEPSYDNDGNIYGVVGNEPADISNIALGQKIGISEEEVSDWMIIDNARLIGGYTIRAIRDGLSEEEIPEFDNSLGMIIDEGEDYFPVDFNTPEGAILSIEEAYNNNDLEKAITCKNFRKEAEFMLGNMSNIPIDDEIIDKTAEVIELSFVQHMQENGMPDFNNVKRAFEREFKSEDHCLVTEYCTFPDDRRTLDKVNTYRENGEWKVLNGE